MQLVFFTYIIMKKTLHLFFFLASTYMGFAQQTYKLYVEGEKQWAYRENPVVGDSSKVAQLESIYRKMLQSVPTKERNTQISLFFGERKKGKGRIFFMTFFEGNLRGKRKDAFFQFLLADNTREGVFKCDTIMISDEKHRFTYKEPSVKLKTRYQKEVMQEYEAHALEKNAKKELENYINTRKRWRKMMLSDE